MICDEVQCGWARSGKMFASQYFAEAGAAPDIMTTAKSIGAGLPLSAVTARAEVMDAVTGGKRPRRAGRPAGSFCGAQVMGKGPAVSPGPGHTTAADKSSG